MANLAASQTDTRLIINRGLAVGNDSKGNLEVRGSGVDSSLLGSVDSKQMVKNLYTSQKNINWSYFLHLQLIKVVILVYNQLGNGLTKKAGRKRIQIIMIYLLMIKMRLM